MIVNKIYQNNMKTVFKPLADLDFSNQLNEAFADTQTGSSLLNKYRQFLLTNESSCNLINNFVKEAQSCLFDAGIAKVVKNVSDAISENKISWRLATACEAINANNAQYNYLNRNAAGQVEKLLEQNEEEVVKYIKAGALKNVMFCEAFRTIVKDVFSDKQTVITESYTAVRPVSYTEINEGKTYFEVLGKIYSIEDNKVVEAKASDVTGDFLVISRLLESAYANFDANAETLTVETPMATYTIYEEDGCKKCKRCSKKSCSEAAKVGKSPVDPEGKDIDDKGQKKSVPATKKVGDNPDDPQGKGIKKCCEELVFTNESEIREHNRLVVGATAYMQRNQMAEILEGLARAFEHFENFALLNNTQIISTNNDKFVVIENNENAYAYCLKSNHSTGWSINTTIVEALDFIKKQTAVDISKDYKENVNKQIDLTEAEAAEKIKESIKNDEMNARKNRIELLTEKFKDDPAKLAVLAKVAQMLNE